MTEASLYERLGGVFAIAAVVDHFSDAVVRNPITGQGSKDPKLDEWSTNDLGRLPGLKFQRTLWVCNLSGGPQGYAATKPGSADLGLEEAHRALEISPAIFDELVAELGRSLDHFNVPEKEKGEVLAAFAAHKGEVTEGYSQQYLSPNHERLVHWISCCRSGGAGGTASARALPPDSVTVDRARDRARDRDRT
jgi:hemoglobin